MARGGRLAMTVSIVLHLAVVAALWRAPAPVSAGAPVVLDLVLTPAPSARLAPRRPPPRATPPRPRAAVAASPPRPAPALAVPVAAAAPAPEPGPVARPDAGAADPPSAPAAAGPVVDPFDAWSRQVWAVINRRRPRAEAGATAARVAFSLDPEGRLTGMRLAASSGSPTFDRAALRAVRAAAPFPRPPPGVAPPRLRFEILIRSGAG